VENGTEEDEYKSPGGRRKKKKANIMRLSVSAHHKKLNGSRPFLTSIFQKACMRADVMTSKSGKISIELIPLVTDPNVSQILQAPVVGTKSLMGQYCREKWPPPRWPFLVLMLNGMLKSVGT
jgi:hypothetical protein